MAEQDPVSIDGLGQTIGARAVPSRDVYADMGRGPVDPDLGKIARLRSQEVRAAFFEGVEMGSDGWSPYPAGDLWSRSRSLKRLANGAHAGFDIVGVWAVCSDPRAAGRSDWRVLGAWKETAWIQSRDPGLTRVDLIVQLASLKRMVGLDPLPTSDTRGWGEIGWRER